MGLYRYWRHCSRCRHHEVPAPSWSDLWKWYPAWKASLAPGHNSMADERPWITFAAAAFIESRLSPSARVFEWGSGGSSLFFARRVAAVVSVEHDAPWFELVRETMRMRGLENWEGYLELPRPDPSAAHRRADAGDSYVSSDAAYRGCTFEEYVSRIDAFPDRSFDVVMIDGRARPSCLRHALPKLHPGGLLVWDNSERDHYREVIETIPATFQRFDFPGPAPYLRHFSRTTAWIVG